MVKTDLSSKGDGTMIRVNANHTVKLNFYDGIYDASGITLIGDNRGGGVLYAAAPASGVKPSEISVYGGQFIGAKATKGSGGIFSIDSKQLKLNISGGVFEGGTARRGGNIYTIGQTTISGGTFKDGIAEYPEHDQVAEGGNLWAASNGSLVILHRRRCQ